MPELSTLTIRSAGDLLSKKAISARELASAYLSEIERRNPELNAYLEVYDDVLAQADEAQKLIDAGGTHPLAGIPMAVKDNILIKGKCASSASKMLEHYRAPYDATAISKLKAAGAVFLGRTNMDEFAMGASTENSAYGPTKNPYDTTRVPGGSSGGSAAAVAANMAIAALGSETGGSIRQPASLCGLVGLKTTYGSVSRYGLMALASSLDQIGPFGKTVSDVETIFETIKGRDPMDSTTISDGTYPARAAKKAVGIPTGLLDMGGVDPDVIRVFEESVARLRSIGYETKEISMDALKYAIPAYYVIVPAEASSNLARYDGVKYGLHAEGKNLIEDYFETRGRGFGAEPRRRILIGTYALSSGYYDAYYNTAAAVRRLIELEYAKAFEEVDFIALPSSPAPAFKLGEKANDPLAMYLEDIFTGPANIAGNPAISIPAGHAAREGKKLPIGFQLQAPHAREGSLFRVGKEFLGEN